jgi:hypothetical protein
MGRDQLAVFPRCSLLTSRTIFALGGEAQISRTAKMVRDARRYRQSGSDRLEKQPTDLRRKTRYFGDRTLAQFRKDNVERPRLEGISYESNYAHCIHVSRYGSHCH